MAVYARRYPKPIYSYNDRTRSADHDGIFASSPSLPSSPPVFSDDGPSSPDLPLLQPKTTPPRQNPAMPVSSLAKPVLVFSPRTHPGRRPMRPLRGMKKSIASRVSCAQGPGASCVKRIERPMVVREMEAASRASLRGPVEAKVHWDDIVGGVDFGEQKETEKKQRTQRNGCESRASVASSATLNEREQTVLYVGTDNMLSQGVEETLDTQMTSEGQRVRIDQRNVRRLRALVCDMEALSESLMKAAKSHGNGESGSGGCVGETGCGWGVVSEEALGLMRRLGEVQSGLREVLGVSRLEGRV